MSVKVVASERKGLILGCMAGAYMSAALTKFARRWLQTHRMWRVLASVPFAKYKEREHPMGFLQGMVDNGLRYEDWIVEIVDGMPVSKALGPSYMPGGVVLFCMDPKLVKHILKDNFQNYTKGSPRKDMQMHFLGKILGGGIFGAMHGPGAEDGGKSWALQRKVASNIFSRGNFNENMQKVFDSKNQRVLNLLKQQAVAGIAVDMSAVATNFSMDSIMEIFFGEKVDSVSGDSCTYGTALDKCQSSLFTYLELSGTFMALADMLPWPLGGLSGLLAKVHGASSAEMQAFRAHFKVLDQESRRMIAAARADPRIKERKDLLALFLAADNFTAEFLRDVVISFMIAGRDTTSSLLSWVLYEISINPEVQEELCREIDEKLPAGKPPTLKSVAPREMPYLTAVIYEALRLHPPIADNEKEAIADDVLPDGTKVPAGTRLTYLPYSMGRDPARYPEPLAFKPRRWIPFAAPLPHEFPVFQAGPRICIGMEMSLFEAKMFLCEVLRAFSFRLKPGEKIKNGAGLTTCPSNSEDRMSQQLLLIPTARAS